MTFSVQGIKYLLEVRDMERAVAFYSRTFGLEVVETSEWWSELRLGQATVALHGGGDGERTMTGLSFTVDDLEAATAAVAAGGGEVLRGPYAPGDGSEGNRLAEFTDPDNNYFMASQAL